MMKYLVGAVVVVASIAVATSSNLAQDKDAKIKCPVSGRAIDKDQSLKHNGGTVYFCCPNCPKAFAKATAKFAAKANLQLVATGQAKEVKCPFTGRDLNEGACTLVDGVKVCFCCNNCLGKAEKLEGQKRVEAIFNDKNFKKGYEVKGK